MLIPLAVYLARRYRQRRWFVAALLLTAACASTVSRTGILMLVVVVIVFLWLRPRETRRLWPAIIPALVVIHFVLPGHARRAQAVVHARRRIRRRAAVERRHRAAAAGWPTSGPALQEWKREPLFGDGFGTRVVDPTAREAASSNAARSSTTSGSERCSRRAPSACSAGSGSSSASCRRFGARGEARRLRARMAARVAGRGRASFAVGMLTYDAFSFIQVTFLLFIFIGLGSALMAERPTPLAVRAKTRAGPSAGAIARGERPGTQMTTERLEEDSECAS